MTINRSMLSSLKVTIMGLGLHGGGAASAEFFARQGAKVTVTDVKNQEQLAPSLHRLSGYPIRFVLGGHNEEDFRNADIVIKNPAVPYSSPFLKIAKQVETDISVFLALSKSPIIAVTGSKGKSSTASAIQFILQDEFPRCKLGGNITVSPLTFLEETDANTPVVLELSSWQLGDLPDSTAFKPRVAVITSIHPDHQDRYDSMESYVADKKLIYRNQSESDITICNYDDAYGREFFAETGGYPYAFSLSELPEGVPGAFYRGQDAYFRKQENNNTTSAEIPLFSGNLNVTGKHQRHNLIAAAAAAYAFGVSTQSIQKQAPQFSGIPHRLEFFHEKNGIQFYNDSAATIPQATKAAIESFSEPLHLITGGTDKSLDFSVLSDALIKPEQIYLLAGSGSAKLIQLLEKEGIRFNGPYSTLEEAVSAAFDNAKPGSCILLSPGCSSFEMFKNEFDRGNQFKEIAARL